jgi:hypothetical protein
MLCLLLLAHVIALPTQAQAFVATPTHYGQHSPRRFNLKVSDDYPVNDDRPRASKPTSARYAKRRRSARYPRAMPKPGAGGGKPSTKGQVGLGAHAVEEGKRIALSKRLEAFRDDEGKQQLIFPPNELVSFLRLHLRMLLQHHCSLFRRSSGTAQQQHEYRHHSRLMRFDKVTQVQQPA